MKNMKRFAQLFYDLDQTNSTKEKIQLLKIILMKCRKRTNSGRLLSSPGEFPNDKSIPLSFAIGLLKPQKLPCGFWKNLIPRLEIFLNGLTDCSAKNYFG